MKTLRLVIIPTIIMVITAAFLLSACGQAGDINGDWNYIKDKGTLILGLDPEFPPMGYNDSGTIKGFDIDVAKEVVKILDVELELKSIDWSTKEQELNTKRIDVIWNGFTMTEARISALNFSVPYLRNNQVIIVKDSQIQSYADLSGKKIGYQFGSSALDAIEANGVLNALENQGFDDNVMALNGLKNNQVGAVIMDEIFANYMIATNSNFADFEVLSQKASYEEFGIGMRKGDNVLQYKINSALRELRDNGKLSEIAVTWFGNDDGLLV